MFEHFEITTTLNKTIENIQISISTQKINLNLSKRFIESILNTIKAFDEFFNLPMSPDGTELVISSTSQEPYFIYNDTDIPISYSTSSSLKILRPLQPYTGEPLYSSTLTPTKKWWQKIHQIHSQTISIHGNDASGEYNGIDYNLPIDKLGSYKLALSSGNNQNDNATFDVTLKAGRKYLTIRSNVIIENCCKSNVEILLDSFQKNSIQKLLAPGGSMAVPLSYVNLGVLNISPDVPSHQFSYVFMIFP